MIKMKKRLNLSNLIKISLLSWLLVIVLWALGILPDISLLYSTKGLFISFAIFLFFKIFNGVLR